MLLALLGKDRKRKPVSSVQCALVGYVCGVLWYLGNCYWIYQTMYLYGGMPKAAALGVLVLFSLYLGLYHALFSWLIGTIHARAGRAIALLAVPFAWVAVEFARGQITGFPWDLLGYTQVDNLVLTSLAPLGGVMMVSFVVAAINAILVAAWKARKPEARMAAAVGGFLLAAGLQLGVLYHPAADASDSIATLLQENLAVGASGRGTEALSAPQKYELFEARSRAPKTPVSQDSDHTYWLPLPDNFKPEFVIWPEAPADFATTDPMFEAQLTQFARSSQATVVAGAVGVEVDKNSEMGYREFGSAAVFDKQGNYLGRYDKIHRVPWGEYVPFPQLFFFAGKLVSGIGRMEAGTKHTLFVSGDHRFGIFICYESIFGDEVRQFAKDGADVLVNISDDGWYGDTGAPWQHLDMARMRAIENRRWMSAGHQYRRNDVDRSARPRDLHDATACARGLRVSFRLPERDHVLHAAWRLVCVALRGGDVWRSSGIRPSAREAKYTRVYVERSGICILPGARKGA